MLESNINNSLSIKCAAHTLQLAVKDFLERNEKQKLIERFRQILRTPGFRSTFRLLKMGRPKIDVVTRWNSTYIMLESLLNVKNICNEHVKDRPTSQEWDNIEQLVSVLKPVYETTLCLQNKALLLGDFYKAWLTLKVVLKLKQAECAEILHACIEKGEGFIK